MKNIFGGMLRRRRELVVIVVGAIFLIQSPLLSQDRRWQVKMSDGSIIGKVELEQLRDDTLFVLSDSGSHAIPVDSIVEVRLVRDISFRDGAKVGWEVGAVAGAIDGAIEAKGPGLPPNSDLHFLADPLVYRPIVALARGIYCGILGSLIGGIVAAIIGTDEVYDFSKVPLAGKLTIINDILIEQ